MLTDSASGPPRAVFFDPSGRRQRILTVLFVAVMGIVVMAAGLLIFGMLGGGHPPRTSVNRGRISPVPGTSTAAARRSPTQSPAQTPPTLPSLPVP